MSNKWLRIILNGLLLGLVQIVFLNNVNFLGYFNPKIFPLFVLLFPINLKPQYYMSLAAFYGFLVDIFSGTQGIGMASVLILAYIRPYLYRLMTVKKMDETEFISKSKDRNFLFKLVMIGLSVFHLVYFTIEMGELYNPFYIIFKTILSTSLAFLFFAIYAIMYVDIDKRDKKIYRRYN
jgi:rod shape-determining protein MreD